MKTLAMLQNPAAKLSEVEPSVAQHYHDKLLEARREKAHVGAAGFLLLVCLSSRQSSIRKNIMQTAEGHRYLQTLLR